MKPYLQRLMDRAQTQAVAPGVLQPQVQAFDRDRSGEDAFERVAPAETATPASFTTTAPPRRLSGPVAASFVPAAERQPADVIRPPLPRHSGSDWRDLRSEGREEHPVPGPPQSYFEMHVDQPKPSAAESRSPETKTLEPRPAQRSAAETRRAESTEREPRQSQPVNPAPPVLSPRTETSPQVVNAEVRVEHRERTVVEKLIESAAQRENDERAVTAAREAANLESKLAHRLPRPSRAEPGRAEVKPAPQLVTPPVREPRPPARSEAPRLVIGNVRVDIVPAAPAPWRAPAPVVRTRPASAPARRDTTRANLRFGLGQV